MGSDAGLTSTRPTPRGDAEREAQDPSPIPTAEVDADTPRQQGTSPSTSRSSVEQTKDDTDEGWGVRGEDDVSARWLRENRPPHWS